MGKTQTPLVNATIVVKVPVIMVTFYNPDTEETASLIKEERFADDYTVLSFNDDIWAEKSVEELIMAIVRDDPNVKVSKTIIELSNTINL